MNQAQSILEGASLLYGQLKDRTDALEAENAKLKADLTFYGEHIMDLECEATRRNAQNERLRKALSAVMHPSLVDAIARGDEPVPTPQLPSGNTQAERRG